MKTQKRILLLHGNDTAPGLMIRIRGNNARCDIDVITRFSDTNVRFGEILGVRCDAISIQGSKYTDSDGCYTVNIHCESGDMEYTHDHDQIARGAELAAQYDYWQDDVWTYMTPKTSRLTYELLDDRKCAIIQQYWLLCDMFYGDLVTLITARMLELFRRDVSWYETIE